MKLVIVEDEKPAAEKLIKSLAAISNEIEVLAVLGSVKETCSWLENHTLPELLIMDIELSDGLSFQVFERSKIDCPIIFTTAYDEYWQEAFEYNSIDYLLKPVKEEKLKAALQKYEKLKQYFSSSYKKLSEYTGANRDRFRKRFLVKRGTDYVSVKSEDIAYFHAAHKMVCLVEKTGRKFILDGSVSDMEKQLDPTHFYRVNRKYLVNINAISRIKSFPKSKLQLELNPPVDDEVIISQEAVSEFKEWIEGK